MELTPVFGSAGAAEEKPEADPEEQAVIVIAIAAAAVILTSFVAFIFFSPFSLIGWFGSESVVRLYRRRLTSSPPLTKNAVSDENPETTYMTYIAVPLQLREM